MTASPVTRIPLDPTAGVGYAARGGASAATHRSPPMSDVVIVESVWPNHAFIEGLGINALTSSKPAAPAGGAVFHDNHVYVRPSNVEA